MKLTTLVPCSTQNNPSSHTDTFYQIRFHISSFPILNMLYLTCKSAMARAHISPRFPSSAGKLSRTYVPVRSRQFSQSTAHSYPRKDSQDRNSINRESTEYSRSGTDDQAAATDDAAFNPDLTDPDSQKKKSGAEEDVSVPLTISDLIFFAPQH